MSNPPPTKPLMVQRMVEQSTIQAHVHEALKDLTYAEMLEAVRAHITARPEAMPEVLEQHAQLLSRHADEVSRD